MDRRDIDEIEEWAKENIGFTDMEELASDLQFDNEEEIVESLDDASDDVFGGFDE